MTDILLSMRPAHGFLVCIDSDGCVFDNMELKHKECFCPATINAWGLQNVSRFAREAAEFVNLYSRTRGTNRFPALVRTLELTAARPEVVRAGWKLPDLAPLKKWIQHAPTLSASALEAYADANPDAAPVLKTAAAWSREVDDAVRRIVRDLRPFPGVVSALEALSSFADIVVISATPHEALAREWAACGLNTYAAAIAGQELGTKAQCIEKAMRGKYAPDHVLKIGDAPGDYAAAQENGVLFYPIIPGNEDDCWRKLPGEPADRFRSGAYRGAYALAMANDFQARLLETPPWQGHHPIQN